MTATHARPASPRMASPVATSELVASLERVLDGLIAQHTRLTELVAAQRAAVRAADAAAVEAAIRDQHATLRAVAELDQQRADLAEQLAARLPAARAGGRLTVSSIAAALPGRGGERLRELGAKLRATIETLRREQSVVRAAAETVLAHLDGVMRQVAGRVSAIGGAAATYGRAGLVASPVPAAIDMTT